MEAEKQQGGEPQENGKAKEMTKRLIRVQTWRKFSEHKCAAPPLDVFNKIPNFKGAEEAAKLLSELEEFKKAKNIKVNMDRAQEPVKLEVLNSGKNLYVPPGRDAEIPSLFTQVTCPADTDIKDQKKIVRLQGESDTRKEIGIDTDIKLDLLVVGSCAVSKLGQRIGKGNGYVDLDVGLLLQLGVITKDTVIITTVHEVQVYDDLPEELFKKYDLPLDIIVTPTEVIRIEKRLPRPDGLDWSLLSQRRVNLIPALSALKEREEKAGKSIVLKEEDTDVESTRKNRQNRVNRRQMRRKRRTRRSEGGGTAENAESNTENEDSAKPPRRRRNVRRRRTNSDQQQNGAESEGNDGKEDGTSKKQKPKQRRQGSKLNNRDLCIKLSNIARNVRIKDLKTELREKSCHPTFISWKGGFGKCYLHFTKKRDQDEEMVTQEILKALDTLSFNVKCEVVKRKVDGEGDGAVDGETEDGGQITENRIETTDVTSV